MHLARNFSHAPCTSAHTHIVAQGVSVRISLHPHAVHDVTCLSVRLLSLRVCLFPVSLPLLPFLFHCLPVRGLKIATGQYSSLCVTLGGDDIEDCVPDSNSKREQ